MGFKLSNNLRDHLVKTDAWLKRHPKSAIVIPYVAGTVIILGGIHILEPEGTKGLLQILVSLLSGDG